jgi:dTDP-4-amino-4,6-dideoxygalactose transaminase
VTPILAAQGGSKSVTIPGPHYQWPSRDRTLDEAVLDQLHRSLSDVDASGVIGEFERAFAAFAGVRHAVSFASGTAAIHAMSRIAGLKPGDAIVAPAYTFLATASPFGFDGVEVLFADADLNGNVTAESIARCLRPDVKAVIVTHMWGHPCAMTDIGALCADRGLLLMEDCSHAHFASWAGRRAGTFGDMAVFSTNQKAITTGEGGVLVTSNDRYRELALLYGHYNKRCLKEISSEAEYYPFAFTGMGLKHRLTTLGAAIGLHQLARAGDIEKRPTRVSTASTWWAYVLSPATRPSPGTSSFPSVPPKERKRWTYLAQHGTSAASRSSPAGTRSLPGCALPMLLRLNCRACNRSGTLSSRSRSGVMPATKKSSKHTSRPWRRSAPRSADDPECGTGT